MDNEAGTKPNTRKNVIEYGDDDCGDNFTELGNEHVLYGYDDLVEELESDDEYCQHTFICAPNLRHTHAYLLNIITSL